MDSDRATSFELLTGSPYRSPILPLFAMVECLVPTDLKHGGVLVIAKGAPRTFRTMWVGRTEESDEHLVVNEIGHVRTWEDGTTMRRIREQWS